MDLLFRFYLNFIHKGFGDKKEFKKLCQGATFEFPIINTLNTRFKKGNSFVQNQNTWNFCQF